VRQETCSCGQPIAWHKTPDGTAYVLYHGSEPDVRRATFGPEDFVTSEPFLVPDVLVRATDYLAVERWLDRVHRRRGQRR
jgi:hypothetical protein